MDTEINRPLKVSYIVLQTGYNNRALADEACCNIILEAMLNLCDAKRMPASGEYVLGDKDGSSHIIPPVISDDGKISMRLLFTYHSGYTWLDEGRTFYMNGNAVSQALIDRLPSVHGAFVFELSDDFPMLRPFEILTGFIRELTEMKFCAFFDLANLNDVTYDDLTGSLVFDFDTESG